MDALRGFSLLELLVAMTVGGVLAALAVPAMDAAMLDARRRATMEALLRGAWLARVEAARRAAPAMLCASRDALACSDEVAAWSAGWIVTAGGEVLRRGPGTGDARARLLANRPAFVFQPFDRRSTNGTLAWCDSRGAARSRSLVISPTGRPRTEAGAGSLPCP